MNPEIERVFDKVRIITEGLEQINLALESAPYPFNYIPYRQALANVEARLHQWALGTAKHRETE